MKIMTLRMNLLDCGAVTKVGSVDELITALNSPQTKPVSADRFFKPNALENMANALEEILQKSKARGATKPRGGNA